jgi:hypothetical protein
MDEIVDDIFFVAVDHPDNFETDAQCLSQSPGVVEIPVPHAIRQWVWFVIGIPCLHEHAVQLVALIFE